MSLLHLPTTLHPPSILTLHQISTLKSTISLSHPKPHFTAITSAFSGFPSGFPIVVSATKEQTWIHEGVIMDSLSNGMFKVELSNGEVILGHLSGKIRKNAIKVMTGDRVSVEVSRYDSSRGRIVFRLRADGSKGTPKKGRSPKSPKSGPRGDQGD